MKKRIISFTLVFILLVSISAGALAAMVTSITFSHSSPFKITAVSDQLIFNLPYDDGFAFLRISLLDNNGNEHNLEWTKREKDDTVVFNLKDIADGTYFVQLYKSPVQYGTYNSYIIGKSIKLVIKDSAINFELARTYESNKLIHGSKRTDSAALNYYLNPSEGIQSDNKSIIALAKNITKDVSGDLEQAQAIHDWVCNNIWYDEDVFYERTPYGEQSAVSTMNSKRGICLGIANLTAALMRAVGIPAKVVTGYALGVSKSEDEWTAVTASGKAPAVHAWNEFYADGRWVITDVTWDTSNTYARGVSSKGTGLYGHYYFDMTLEVFSAEHLIYDYTEDHIPDESETVSAPLTNGSAMPSSSKVVINDRELTFEAYNINGENYFKLRDVAFAINGTSKQFNAKYDNTTKAIDLISGTAYASDGTEMKKGDGKTKTATPTASKIYKNGIEIKIAAYNIGGNNFFKMRDIAAAFNIFVDYVNGVIIVDTSRNYAAL